MTSCKVIQIEEAAEALGDLVDNCEDWSLILETVFPGLYGTRKVSEKAVAYYTDGSSKRITRYARRAWQGIQVFNPEDQDGTTAAKDAQAQAAKHSPIKDKNTGLAPKQQRPRLLLELEEAAAFMLGTRATMPNVQGQRPAGSGQ